MKDNNNLKPLLWADILSVGIPDIDEQHRKLLTLLNKCIEMLSDDRQHNNLSTVFHELCEYTKYHFQYEEKALLEDDFPYLEKHKKVHQWLIKELQRQKIDYEQGNLKLEALIQFLSHWINDHIMGMDKLAFSYCIGNKEQKAAIISNKGKILLVDDDKDFHKLLQHGLSDYTILSAFSGREALEVYLNNEVDLILLDVAMNDKNGYEICKQIRSQRSDSRSPIPIIFLSGKTSLEDIIEGYDSGGTDYLTKPFKLSELRSKISVEVNAFHLEKELQSNLSDVTDAVLTVQNTNAKIYSICRFLQKSFFCQDIDSLCQLFFTVTQGFGTQATLYVHSQKNAGFYNSNGKNHAMSNSILEQVRLQGGRIFQFGNDRAIFNWEFASVLVNKLQDDVDNLALLMDGFEMGLKAIQASNDFEGILTDYKEFKNQQSLKVTSAFDDVIFEIQDELNRTGYDGLSEQQEKALIHIVETKSDMVDGLFKKGVELDDKLSQVMSNLRKESNDEKEADDGLDFF